MYVPVHYAITVSDNFVNRACVCVCVHVPVHYAVTVSDNFVNRVHVCVCLCIMP